MQMFHAALAIKVIFSLDLGKISSAKKSDEIGMKNSSETTSKARTIMKI
jgi:hypothetical protein